MENSRKSNYTNRYEQFIFIFESLLLNLNSKVFYNDYICIPMLVKDMVTNAVIEICMDPVLMKAAEEKNVDQMLIMMNKKIDKLKTLCPPLEDLQLEMQEELTCGDPLHVNLLCTYVSSLCALIQVE